MRAVFAWKGAVWRTANMPKQTVAVQKMEADDKIAN
jgi:hypothetical protein